MRNAAFFPVTLLFLALPLLAQVDVKYDEGAGVTSVSVPAAGAARDAFTVTASFECPGDRVCVPVHVQLIFAALSRHPEYAKNHEVTLVLNRETEIRDVRTRYIEGASPSAYRGVTEFIVCDTPREDFASIASAKRVEYQVGSTKGRLSKKQLAALAALAGRIEAAKGS